MTIPKDFREKTELLRELLVSLGRPYLVILYDKEQPPGTEWKATATGVGYWVKSSIEPSSVAVAIEHVRKTVEVEQRARLECPCSWVPNAQRVPGCPRCGGPDPSVKEDGDG